MSRQSSRPALETLEDRRCPASVSLTNGILTVTGGEGRDSVYVVQDDAEDSLTVYSNVKVGGITVLLPATFASSAVHDIKIDLKGGDDTLDYRLASDATRAKDVFADLGYGDDFAHLRLAQAAVRADLAFVLLGDKFSLDPNQPAHGNDMLVADVGHVISARLAITAAMGGGEDYVDVALLGKINGTGGVNLGLFGSAGGDDIYVEAKNVTVGPKARLDVWMDGDGGDDHLSFVYSGKNDGRIGYHIDAGGELGDLQNALVQPAATSTGQVVIVP
jgi:hypothetical protein